MKRRDLLKSWLAAPFVGLLKGKKKEYSCSAGSVRCASMDSSVETKSEGNFVYRGHSFKWSRYKPLDCYILSLKENDDLISHLFDEDDFDNAVNKKLYCDSMIAKIESWQKNRRIWKPVKFTEEEKKSLVDTVDIKQRFPLDTILVTNEFARYRYVKQIYQKTFFGIKTSFWFWIPESEWMASKFS